MIFCRAGAIVGLVAGFVLSACVSSEPPPEAAQAICEGEGLTILTEIPGAGLHGCSISGAGEATITVMHERSTSGPVNPSPWYGFLLRVERPQTVKVTLDYLDYEHRYAPWVSRKAGPWIRVPEGQVATREEGRFATVTLDVDSDFVFVAAHPIVTAADTIMSARFFAAEHDLRETSYGTSVEGRSLLAVEKGAESADKIIIALTRQHPPELPGTAGYDAFMETLLAEAPDGFWDEHLLVAVPLPNPDGVEHGHWRLNSGGVDLNRDWYEPSQPEIAALTAYLKARAEGRRAVAMFDFHSTWNTVIYTPPFENASPDAAFLPQLKAQLDEPGCSEPEWKPGHRADSGTSKSWGLEVLGAPAITVEFGDNEDPETVSCMAAEIAREVIAYSQR